MPDIRDTLERIKISDQQRFLTIRNALRKSYIMSVQGSVGVNNWSPEDDTYMDSIDLKVEMLMTRAGVQTPTNENREMQPNASDPFSLITRPLEAAPVVLTAKVNDQFNTEKFLVNLMENEKVKQPEGWSANNEQ